MLTKSKILEQLESGGIFITPFNSECLQPNSYDLHLSKHIKVWRSGVEEFEDVTIPADGIVFGKADFVLASTTEYTETHHFIPIVRGKSSNARYGIQVCGDAGLGDVGFKGHWTLELHFQKPVRLYAGMPICQICYFQPVQADAVWGYSEGEKYTGNYQNQPAVPVESKTHTPENIKKWSKYAN